MGEPLNTKTITELAGLLRNKEVSPVEVAACALDRIDTVDAKVRAFVTVMRDDALRQAQAAEKAILAGEYRGPLHGIPVGIKDIYYTVGTRTSAGSEVLAKFLPTYDATVVAKLKAAGAVLLGKTNTHEFAYGVVTPPTRNPWKTEHIPGGSSGGSAAALAASMCPAATGSDTAGSIRIPAALCGVVGLKPTYGRVSKYGVIPLSWSMDHAGPLTRSVEDAALMLSVMAGYDGSDAASADRPVPDFSAALTGDLQGLRLGVPSGYFFDPIDAEVDAAWQRAIARLEALGASVEEVVLPHLGACGLVTFYVVLSEASAYHERWLAASADKYGQGTLGLLKMGSFLLATHYLKAQRLRVEISNDFDEVFKKVDAVVSPTLPVCAPLVGADVVKLGEEMAPVLDILIRNTMPYNVTGLPAVTVPSGFSAAGLPIGLQVAGRPFDEGTILNIAYAFAAGSGFKNQQADLG